jgi:hypothetical protein
MNKWYKRFKKRYRVLNFIVMSTLLVVFWWGTWNLLDLYAPALGGEGLPYLLGVVVALIFLYFGGFHLKELE